MEEYATASRRSGCDLAPPPRLGPDLPGGQSKPSVCVAICARRV